MQYLVSGSEMKSLDANTTKHFLVPEIVLMEQAANVFVDIALTDLNQKQKFVVVCGIGNNGADGIAIARLMNQRGYNATVYIPFLDENKATDSFTLQRNIYWQYQYPVITEVDWTNENTILIDALFGIGLSREIEGEYRSLIEQMDAKPGYKIAVDIPSGISADNGQVLGASLHVDRTITFSYGKIGQYVWPGAEYCGSVTVASMGITKDSWLEHKPSIAVAEWMDLEQLVPRKKRSNKGTYGKLLVIAGSRNMAGAAYLCAKAAYRAGCGLVKIFTVEENRTILQTKIPEAILDTIKVDSLEKQLITNLNWADAVVLGPGIGTDIQARKLTQTAIQNNTKPIVLDADALNIISSEPELWEKLKAETIITPHLGEMARLTGETIELIQKNMMDAARCFANEHQVICVLKDARTMISVPGGMNYLNISGNHGMATAGSGDVLAGIIGSLLAQHNIPEVSAYLGAYIHGVAGDIASSTTGYHGMLADDIIDGLKVLWKRVNNNE